MCKSIKDKLLKAQTKVINNIQDSLKDIGGEDQGLMHNEEGFGKFFKNFQAISESVNEYLSKKSEVPVNLSETSGKKLSKGEIIYLFWPLMFEAADPVKAASRI